MTPRGTAEHARTEPASAGGERVLVLFLRALMAARKSLSLYPPGSEIASTWIRRLHRSLADFFQQGLCFPLRVDPDRFAWPGPDVRTAEPSLEAFRFDLESRGIRELEVDAAVEEWELQAFLELLNTPGSELRQLGGASAFLSERGVLRVRIAAPGDAEDEDSGSEEATRRALQTGRDAVDLFVETLIGLVEARFADLTYDRTALAIWLEAGAQGAAGRLYESVRMLHGLVEAAPDREVRTRTLVEALLSLPAELLRPFFTDHVIPLAGREVLALNLLSQMTEDELRHMAARLVPQESLLALSSELLEFPWEEAQRRRLVEAITSAIRADEEPNVLGDDTPILEADDPLVVELREEIIAACQPDALIERSADILVALVLSVGDDYATSAVDALEEIVGEALARGRIELATRVLSTVAGAVQAGGARSREHVQHLAVLQQRLAGRTHIALVGGLLRQHGSSERQLVQIAQYLGLVASDAIQEFTGLLAEERDRQVRARMCQVLAKVGPPAVPVLLDWLEDPRWFLVRNLVHVLGKIGDEERVRPRRGAARPSARPSAHRGGARPRGDRAGPGGGAARRSRARCRRRGPGRGGPGTGGASAGRGRPAPARRGGGRVGRRGRSHASAGSRGGAGEHRDLRGPRGARGTGAPARLVLEPDRAPAARRCPDRPGHAAGERRPGR